MTEKTTDQATEGAKKIALLMQPLLTELENRMIQHMNVNKQECLLAIESARSENNMNMKALLEKKKPVSKKAAEGTTPTIPVAGAPDTLVQQPENARMTFPINKLVWFREMYKTDEKHRDKYTSQALKDLMDKDETIQQKAEGQQRWFAKATFVYNHIKASTDQLLMKQIEDEYAAGKKAYEESHKPAQQVTEAQTPPKTD